MSATARPSRRLVAALVPAVLLAVVAWPMSPAGARSDAGEAELHVVAPRPGTATGVAATTAVVSVPDGATDPQVRAGDVAVPATIGGGLLTAAIDLDDGVTPITASAVVDGVRVEVAWEVTRVADPPGRLSGPDRVETALEAARTGWPDGADAAVIARSDDFADALSGSALAGELGGPLLLTHSAGVDPRVAELLADVLEPGAEVHLMGGASALGDGVAEELDEAGWTVVRHAGADRFATATLVAARLGDATTALVASGEGFADAVSAAAPAADRGWPLLLVATDALPDVTADAAAGFEELIVIGGTAAVSPDVTAALADLGPQVRRIAGDGRTATAAAVAAELGPHGDDVLVASGADFPDALAGGVLAAQAGAGLVLMGDTVDQPVAATLTARASGQVTVLGGTGVVDDRALTHLTGAVADARVAGSELPAPPVVEPPPGGTLDDSIRIAYGPQRGIPDEAWSLTIEDVPVTATVVRGTDDSATLTITDASADLPTGRPLAARLTARVDGPGSATRHLDVTWTTELLAPTVVNSEGFEVVTGTGAVVGTGGPLFTYSVEVDPRTGEDPAEVAAVVDRWLHDTERGWVSRGERRVQRVDSGARIRVVVAPPGVVDAYCARVGLNTAGIYSCWDGRRTMLNHMRWTQGAPPHFTDVDTYRGYLINHEVGHGFGFGHVGCPAAGAPAPVMMQQTIRIEGCRPNPFPFP